MTYTCDDANVRKCLDNLSEISKVNFLDKYGYIIEPLNKMPRYTYLDETIARELAVMALSASYLCSDLSGDATRLVLELKAKVKEEEAGAMERVKSTKVGEKEKMAQKDEALIMARKKLASAEALLSMLIKKHEELMATHYYCKSVVMTTVKTSGDSFMYQPGPEKRSSDQDIDI